MVTLKRASRTIVNTCLGIKENENVLILIDKNKLKIGQAIFSEASKISKNVKMIEIPVGKRHGEEPPRHIANMMKNADVVIMPVTKSLSHTKARKDSTKNGVRIASMPNITEDMMKRTLSADYKKIRETTINVAKKFKDADKVRIVTNKGTDLSFSIKHKKWHGLNGGIFTKKGEWGNLPEGEACIGPVEGSANGVFVVDASMGFGLMKTPLKITVENGFATKIEGKDKLKLFKMFKGLPKKAFNIAEFGIGTNYNAKITGNVLEDEKVPGTCHIALGNNMSFEGTVDVPVHIDGVMKKPTVYADGKKVISKGKVV